MHTFIATSGKLRHIGGYLDCMNWCREMVAANHTRICHIVRSRKGADRVPIIAEITEDGIRPIEGGRTVALHTIMRLANV